MDPSHFLSLSEEEVRQYNFSFSECTSKHRKQSYKTRVLEVGNGNIFTTIKTWSGFGLQNQTG